MPNPVDLEAIAQVAGGEDETAIVPVTTRWLRAVLDELKAARIAPVLDHGSEISHA